MLLSTLGAKVRFAGPRTLLAAGRDAYPVETFDRLEPALEGADVVMMLRIQHERLSGGALCRACASTARYFGLNDGALSRAKPDAHRHAPGPDEPRRRARPEVADGPRSVILDQVEAGVAVRMAVLYLLSAEPGQAPLA